MSYSDSNTILSKLNIDPLLEQVKNKAYETVLKANIELKPENNYLLLVRKESDEGKEFINKTVVIDKKHEYIDVFSQKYVKEIIKKTGHKLKVIAGEGFLSLAYCESKPKKEVKKEAPEIENTENNPE